VTDFLIVVFATLACYGLLIAGIEYFSRRAARDKRRARGTAAAARPAGFQLAWEKLAARRQQAHADAMHAVSAPYLPVPHQPKHAAGKPRRDKQPWETDHLPVMRPEPYTPAHAAPGYGEKPVAEVLEAERLNQVMQP